MNFTTLAGFIIALVVFLSAVFLSVSDFRIFLDFKSALIVFGGTIAAALISFPMSQLRAMLMVFFKRLLGANRRNYIEIILEVVRLSKASLQGTRAFEAAAATVKDPFLKDGAAMLFWAQSEITTEELRELLETRARTHYKQYMAEAKVFKTIARFPPAFGLMGTALGIVALLQAMGDADAKDKLGPAMAIALVTTIYGLSSTNFIFMPIAENLIKQTEEDLICRRLVVEGLMLIHLDKPPRYVEEMLKSFLLPGQRKALSIPGSGSDAGGKAA